MIVLGGAAAVIFLVAGSVFLLVDVIGKAKKAKQEKKRRDVRSQVWQKRGKR